MTLEERLAQMRRHQESAEEEFKKEAPQAKIRAGKIEPPLTIIKLSHISRWIFRDQISLDDLTAETRKEFMTSKQYRHLVKARKV